MIHADLNSNASLASLSRCGLSTSIVTRSCACDNHYRGTLIPITGLDHRIIREPEVASMPDQYQWRMITRSWTKSSRIDGTWLEANKAS